MGRFINLRVLVLVGAVVVGFLTIFLMTRYMSLRESQIAAALRAKLAREGFTTLAVAEREIAPGMTVTGKDVKTAPWPKKALLKGAFDDSKKVVGRAAARRILAGEPILEGHLIPKGGGTFQDGLLHNFSGALSTRFPR